MNLWFYISVGWWDKIFRLLCSVVLEMSEIHTYSTWKTSCSLGAKNSIPTSVQGCPHSPNLNRLYVNTTPRYLGWFGPLVHLLMFIGCDKILRNEDFHFKQRKRSSSCVRHSPVEQDTHPGCRRAIVGEIKACPRGTGAGEGHAPLSFGTMSSDPLGT